MIAATIDISEAQTRWLELLGLVLAGNEVVVTQAQKPVMRLAPIVDNTKQRVAGLHAGMGWVSDDFDAPLPDEFWVGADHTCACSRPRIVASVSQRSI